MKEATVVYTTDSVTSAELIYRLERALPNELWEAPFHFPNRYFVSRSYQSVNDSSHYLDYHITPQFGKGAWDCWDVTVEIKCERTIACKILVKERRTFLGIGVTLMALAFGIGPLFVFWRMWAAVGILDWSLVAVSLFLGIPMLAIVFYLYANRKSRETAWLEYTLKKIVKRNEAPEVHRIK